MTVAGPTLLGGLLNAQQIDAPAWTYIEMLLYLVVGWIRDGRGTQTRHRG